MKRIAFQLFFLVTLLSSCGMKIYPSKGEYPKPPIVHYSSKSFSDVWDNIIDLFAQNGIPIAVIDRSSGLIVSTPTILSWSTEDDNGVLQLKGASVVIDRVFFNGRRFLQSPTGVTGRWNIRIKESNGRTSVNVNLTDITAFNTITDKYGSRDVTNKNYNPKTTGNFERRIYNAVK